MGKGSCSGLFSASERMVLNNTQLLELVNRERERGGAGEEHCIPVSERPVNTQSILISDDRVGQLMGSWRRRGHYSQGRAFFLYQNLLTKSLHAYIWNIMLRFMHSCSHPPT